MADIKKVLRRLAEEMDAEDKDSLLEELKGKKLTSAELVEAIKGMDTDSRAEIRSLLAEVTEEVEDEEDGKTPKPKPKAKETEEEEKTDPKRRTRPGRKSGRAYGWWIDDDGEVVKLDIARVYSGEDEPDEVELLPKEDEEDEEEVA